MTSTMKEGEILKRDVVGRVWTPKERREALLDEFEASGLSGAKFAQMVGVKYPTFANWAKQRRESGQGSTNKGAPGVPALRWVEAVVDKAAGETRVGLTIHLPGGARMQIADPGQAALAASLLRALAC